MLRNHVRAFTRDLRKTFRQRQALSSRAIASTWRPRSLAYHLGVEHTDQGRPDLRIARSSASVSDGRLLPRSVGDRNSSSRRFQLGGHPAILDQHSGAAQADLALARESIYSGQRTDNSVRPTRCTKELP